MKPLIIANWKMNPSTLDEALNLAAKIECALAKLRNIEVVIAPPFPFLVPISRRLKKSKLGAQNVFFSAAGAWTGEVSPLMLKDLGVSYVIVGHSERRHLGETDEMINRKIKACLKIGLLPVLAIGEEERESKEVVPPAISNQLRAALAGIVKYKLRKLVVAYEPVWAISTTAGAHDDTPDNATRRAIYIRKLLTKFLGANIASKIRILYGGSVKVKNAASFLTQDIRGMEGLLVGGASLKAEEFIRIVQSVAVKFRHH